MHLQLTALNAGATVELVMAVKYVVKQLTPFGPLVHRRSRSNCVGELIYTKTKNICGCNVSQLYLSILT